MFVWFAFASALLGQIELTLSFSAFGWQGTARRETTTYHTILGLMRVAATIWGVHFKIHRWKWREGVIYELLLLSILLLIYNANY